MKTTAQLLEEIAELRETIRQLTEPTVGIWYEGFLPSYTERVILDALLRTHGPVGGERLRMVLDTALRRIDPSGMNSISVTIHRMRHKMATLDPPIRILTQWGQGFYLDDESRARLMLRRHTTRTTLAGKH